MCLDSILGVISRKVGGQEGIVFCLLVYGESHDEMTVAVFCGDTVVQPK